MTFAINTVVEGGLASHNILYQIIIIIDYQTCCTLYQEGGANYIGKGVSIKRKIVLL